MSMSSSVSAQPEPSSNRTTFAERDITHALTVPPWAMARTSSSSPVLHLVIAWYPHAPELVGYASPITRSCSLGRGLANGELPRVGFGRRRPGDSADSLGLVAPTISRHQLQLEPTRSGLAVRNVGKCALLHNGRRVREALARPGDTLSLEDTLVLLVDERCNEWPDLDPALTQHPFACADDCGMVGESEAIVGLRRQLRRAAATDAHVLVHGPSGAGKELAARAIHHLSRRRHGPLICRNAATLPESLIDVELFGCEKNFPNAGMPARKGLIGEADGGSLLLDEIGELPHSQQTHLLRVLDSDGEYQALGDPRTRRSDLRVVAVTNRALSELRGDFLARFAVRVEVPELRARASDIPLLMRCTWRSMCEEQPALRQRFLSVRGGPSWEPLTEPRLTELLLRHAYVHNTRELDRLLRLAVDTSPGEFVAATRAVEQELCVDAGQGEEHRPAPRGHRLEAPPGRHGLEAVAGRHEIEAAPGRHEIEAALRGCARSPTRAARELGLRNRHVLYRLMKKHGL